MRTEIIPVTREWLEQMATETAPQTLWDYWIDLYQSHLDRLAERYDLLYETDEEQPEGILTCDPSETPETHAERLLEQGMELSDAIKHAGLPLDTVSDRLLRFAKAVKEVEESMPHSERLRERGLEISDLVRKHTVFDRLIGAAQAAKEEADELDELVPPGPSELAAGWCFD